MMAKAASTVAASNSIATAQAEARVEELEERIGRLLVVSEAMWEIIKRHGYTDDDLKFEIEQVSSRNAEREREAGRCAACGSRLSPEMPRCQICGEATGLEPNVIGNG
jgi:hypothetical protein